MQRLELGVQLLNLDPTTLCYEISRKTAFDVCTTQHAYKAGDVCSVRCVVHRQSLMPYLNRELTTRCGGIVEAFFKKLSLNEKELFKATTLKQRILEKVRNADKTHKDKNNSRKAFKALNPFLAGINQYGQALDVGNIKC